MVAGDRGATVSRRGVNAAWHVGVRRTVRARAGIGGAVRSAPATRLHGSRTDPQSAKPDLTALRLVGLKVKQGSAINALSKACPKCLRDLTLQWDAYGGRYQYVLCGSTRGDGETDVPGFYALSRPPMTSMGLLPDGC